ncbi:hypothetical protein RFI_13748 [Reticulomyxa filosa]|uniref:Uncharacterized protein n=1 Tax=Reticulomyxa filosa TaxID=46433 RepID=X6NC29_RETFI|nr:hypothetical protein RFI_13748 [Reticulomyxa filosa]|eukprot:ETO23433.1 hypothetical protein RFI_13748 [Reticulomyxa filosa]
MLAFNKHIPRIIKFIHQKDQSLQLNALRTLAFVSSNRQLHKLLFQNNILDLAIHFLQSSKSEEIWEAGLVVLNQICYQSKEDFKEKKGKPNTNQERKDFNCLCAHKINQKNITKEWLDKFWDKKDHLNNVIKCGFIDDGAVSIIGNTFSLLAKIIASDKGTFSFL